jgi:hypothetical protein
MIELVEFLRARGIDERIIDYCLVAIKVGEIPPNATWSDDAAGAEVARTVLHLMAMTFSDHPDYDPAWTVSWDEENDDV